MTDTYKIIKKFVKDNYGKSEADNPSYNLQALADEIDSRYKLKAIKERLQSLLEYKLEREFEDYFLYHTTGGFGETGCAKNEDVFDEVKAKEDLIDYAEWTEDSQLVELINKLLWEL